MVIKEIFTPDIAITWLPWAVQYFFMMGLAYASVWVATIHLFSQPKPDDRLLKLCACLMLTAGIVAPIALLADLHQPLRAWHFYAQVRPDSWMWYGAFLLPVFSGTSAVFAWLLLRQYLPKHTTNQDSDWVNKIGQLLRFGDWNSDKFIKPIALITALSACSIPVRGRVSGRPGELTMRASLLIVAAGLGGQAGPLGSLALALTGRGLHARFVVAIVQSPANLYELVVAHNPQVLQACRGAMAHGIQPGDTNAHAHGAARQRRCLMGGQVNGAVGVQAHVVKRQCVREGHRVRLIQRMPLGHHKHQTVI